MNLADLAMETGSLFAVAFVGGVFWIFNSEATAAYYAAERGWPPVAVAAVCAAGQVCVYGLLFRTGGWLVPRWGWLRRQVERTKKRFGARLEKSYLWTTAVAAVAGVPPLSAMAVLADGFAVPMTRFLVLAGTLRFVRFLVCAQLGERLTIWLAS